MMKFNATIFILLLLLLSSCNIQSISSERDKVKIKIDKSLSNTKFDKEECLFKKKDGHYVFTDYNSFYYKKNPTAFTKGVLNTKLYAYSFEGAKESSKYIANGKMAVLKHTDKGFVLSIDGADSESILQEMQIIAHGKDATINNIVIMKHDSCYYKTVLAKISINKYPSISGDTIIGYLDYKGIRICNFDDNTRLQTQQGIGYQGYFEVVVE